jgi:glycosyltransferase involved in cell wall biosynthesis
MAAAHLAVGFATLVGGEHAHLVTAAGLVRPEQVIRDSVHGGGTERSSLSRLPTWARLGVGDAQAIRRSVKLRGVRVPEPLALVVQFHQRFQDVGLRLSRRHGCPLVLRVEALEVEEQRAWGLRGPRSGRLVERLGEHRLFHKADLLCPVSPSLQHSLEKIGVPPHRILTGPNGVDLELFDRGPGVSDRELREHDLEGRFLVGWVGGFRPYHGLAQVEQLVTALESVLPDVTICLLGTGPLRGRLEDVARRHPLSLRLLPPVAQEKVPAWLNRFDVCLQLADPKSDDHYSSLKVLEYLACARPVLAPVDAGSDLLRAGENALVYPPGDLTRLVAGLTRLHDESALRDSLSSGARTTAEQHGSWAAIAGAMLHATRTQL